MSVISTEFEGLLILEPKVFRDDRGEFYESWRNIDYQKYGIKENFLQDNISISKKNVLRGLHYQKNQGQLITVISGAIFDVAVDIRKNSKTFKKYFSIELSSNQPKQVYIPPGFAHGFCVLSDFVIMNYKCTEYYDPTIESGIFWNDKEICIAWPEQNFIISEKDQLLKPLL
jgi:dTDP-4-dehydrorhamnose 3,5-epimerase